MDSKPIYGLHSGLLIGQHDRVDELNDRILDRAFDNKPVNPVFGPRAASTKYSLFHILDRRPKMYLDDKVTVGHDVETETDLYGRKERTGVYDSGSKFRPSLESNMYKVTVGKPTDKPPEERALLFTRPTFDTSPVHPNLMSAQIGGSVFYNHTRTQLRGSH
jgi:hypothetical protein